KTSAFHTITHERYADIETASRRLMSRNAPVDTNRIVAGLSFGFWVGMLRASYHPEIWSAHLRNSFPHLPATENRGSLARKAKEIADLRNRISHHEPVFKSDLMSSFSDIMKMLKWMCPATHDWIRPHCRIPEIMRQKP